ncbi:MAG: YlmC/YmxH family sporulation protein [Pygmaiobacter massiliensis]|nr:YlmC/YmxH family sporulation protein [Pygmaiobacter massiliensis]
MISLLELCDKDVISLLSGANLGRVDDLNIDEVTSQVTELIIYGKLRWFGLLGREEDIKIPWQEIATIGQDAILVRTLPARVAQRQKKPIKF